MAEEKGPGHLLPLHQSDIARGEGELLLEEKDVSRVEQG